MILRVLSLSLPISLAALTMISAAANAGTTVDYDCGSELGFTVQLDAEAGKARFAGPYDAVLAADGSGGLVNEEHELQFWPEEMPPALFIGSEQFSCEIMADAGTAASATGDAGTPAGMASLADLAPAAYASVKGWDVQALADASGFVGCAASIEQPAGFLILAKMPWGWTLRIPGPGTEGFEGGVIAVDGKAVDAQFGFTAESAAEAGLSDGQVAAIRNGSAMTTQIAGGTPVAWSLAGSAAMLGKIDECQQRKGTAP